MQNHLDENMKSSHWSGTWDKLRYLTVSDKNDGMIKRFYEYVRATKLTYKEIITETTAKP